MEHIKLAPPRRRPRRVARKISLRLGAKHHRDWVRLFFRCAFADELDWLGDGAPYLARLGVSVDSIRRDGQSVTVTGAFPGRGGPAREPRHLGIA